MKRQENADKPVAEGANRSSTQQNRGVAGSSLWQPPPALGRRMIGHRGMVSEIGTLLADALQRDGKDEGRGEFARPADLNFGSPAAAHPHPDFDAEIAAVSIMNRFAREATVVHLEVAIDQRDRCVVYCTAVFANNLNHDVLWGGAIRTQHERDGQPISGGRRSDSYRLALHRAGINPARLRCSGQETPRCGGSGSKRAKRDPAQRDPTSDDRHRRQRLCQAVLAELTHRSSPARESGVVLLLPLTWRRRFGSIGLDYGWPMVTPCLAA